MPFKQSLLQHLTNKWTESMSPEEVCINPNDWVSMLTQSHFLLWGGIMAVISVLSWVYGDANQMKVKQVGFMDMIVMRSPSLFRSVNGFLACLMAYEATPYIYCHEYLFGGLLLWCICTQIWINYGMPMIKASTIQGYQALMPEADQIKDWVQKGKCEYSAETFYVNIAKSNFEIVLVFVAHVFAFMVWYVQLLHFDVRGTMDSDLGCSLFLAACIMMPIMEPIVNGHFPQKQDVFKSIRGFMDQNPGKKFFVYGKNGRGKLVGGGWEITRARNVHFREFLSFWVNAVGNTFQFVSLPILMATSDDFYTLVIGIGGSAMLAGLNGCEATAITIEVE